MHVRAVKQDSFERVAVTAQHTYQWSKSPASNILKPHRKYLHYLTDVTEKGECVCVVQGFDALEEY